MRTKQASEYYALVVTMPPWLISVATSAGGCPPQYVE